MRFVNHGLQNSSNKFLFLSAGFYQRHGSDATHRKSLSSISSASSTNPSDEPSSGRSRKKSQEGGEQSPKKTPKLKRFTSKSSSKEESHKVTAAEGEENTHDINKNHLTSSATPSQKRKHVFLEKVQKYIHHSNNKKQQRKHSLDTLLDEPRTRRSISGDLLDAGYLEKQKENSAPSKRTKSFQILQKGNDQNNHNTDEFDKLLIHEPLRKRASTLGAMDELPTQITSAKQPSWDNELNSGERNHGTGNQQQTELYKKSRNNSARNDEFTENDGLLRSCSNDSNYDTNNTADRHSLALLPNGRSIDAFVVVKSPAESSASGNMISTKM